MAKFEVGQRVRIKVGKRTGEEGTVNSLPGVGHQSFTNYLLDTSEGELLYMESELEPISTVFQPGDIVRAEKGDEIIQGKVYGSEISTTLGDTSMDDFAQEGYTLTLIKRPEPQIVLPTNRYALIEIDSWIYVRGFGGAWSTIGSFSKVSHSSMETRARKSGFYRVIFEGENE